MTFVLGLTGSIGMGKSATASMFQARGVPVHDADAAVHELYRGKAVAAVGALFPDAIVDGAVDRSRLGAIVLGSPDKLRELERIVHPLVREAEAAFLETALAGRHPVAVLDVPLLLETGGEARCDAVLVVTADSETQRTRVLARPGMTPETFAQILAKQMPDSEKRRGAHFLVDTSHGFPHAEAAVCDILRSLAGRPGRVLRQPASASQGGES